MKLLQQKKILQLSKKRILPPVNFLAAIYALSTIDSELLTKIQWEVIRGLSHYGFIVYSTVSDGTSKDRAANKNITTLTAQVVLVNNQARLDELKRACFPMSIKLAFNHLTILDDGIVVFIDSDMLHLILKIVNALERSGLSENNIDLHVHGNKLSLKILHQLWCESGSNVNDFVRNINK